MAELTLYEFSIPDVAGQDSWSPFVMKVMRTLHFLGLPYRRVMLTGPRDLARLNPAAQLPVLDIDGEHVCDSSRIVRRLEALTGRSLGGPEDWLWEEFADTSLYGLVLAARWVPDAHFAEVRARYFNAAPALVRGFLASMIRRKILTSLHGRDVTRGGLEPCWERYRGILDHLDVRAPDTGFWTGPELTIADIALFSMLHALRTPCSPPQAEWVAEKARLTAWLGRVEAVTTGGPEAPRLLTA